MRKGFEFLHDGLSFIKFFTSAHKAVKPANNDHSDHGALFATDNSRAAFSAIQNTLIFRSFK
jgi:hypothetical protein